MILNNFIERLSMTSKIDKKEFLENFDNLQDYDYVEILKDNRVEGLFVSAKFAKEVKEFLDAKIKSQNKMGS